MKTVSLPSIRYHLNAKRLFKMDALRNIRQTNVNSIVDKDVQSMLLPLNIMCFPKYRIKSNAISPNSLIIRLVTMILILLFMCSCIYVTYAVSWHRASINYTSFVAISIYFDCIFYCSGFALDFVLNILQAKKNIQFVLTFQEIHRFLNNETDFNQFIIWNWVLVIVALGFYAIFLYTFWMLLGLSYIALIASYTLVVFDLNTIYLSRILKLLESKVRLWNIKILNSQEIYGLDENNAKIIFQAYANILECYNIHKYCSQQFVST